MKLHEFVKEALIDIARGVSSASDELTTLGAWVPKFTIPSANNDGIARVGDSISGTTASIVTFDVAVTATDSGGAKGGVQVMSLFDFGANAERSKEVASRVRFQVPVVLPYDRKR